MLLARGDFWHRPTHPTQAKRKCCCCPRGFGMCQVRKIKGTPRWPCDGCCLGCVREQVYLMEVLTFRSPLFSVLNFTALTVPKMLSSKLGTRSWSWNPSSRFYFVLYHDNSLNSLTWRINTCHYLLTLRWFVFYIKWLVEDVISVFLPEGQWKKMCSAFKFFCDTCL